MNPPIIIGALALIVAVCHEASWWKRRHWKRLPGRVVDVIKQTRRNKTSYHPVITYSSEKGDRQFTSKYGGNTHPKIGDAVVVMVSPDGESEEHYSISNRWFISGIAFCIGIVLLGKGIIEL
ncbi:Protein of unknown function [Rubritalea squalenifaciens DSM 18772]|uniref:DUF3592 domain-containing protein n=1 Tax=Rubritalea squalenifaciens DSM 18772 TaxID=1123071 RepID=A0A1M6CKZ1_9BACT|nr:DUF3592 domain-containing protein [Rubritalea squalenifaciens]SHI61677.1 Protein of unknown function [Rubritalea squalenifaciens DSM 18772]